MAWQALLDFWFGALTEGVADPQVRANWFVSSSKFDDQCRQFETWLHQIHSGELDDWRRSPQACLALILLCDQIPRNIYRGQAKAYSWDSYALAAAREGIDQRADLALAWDERAFFYMPFEHSESQVDQHTAVGLFAKLRDDVPKVHKNLFGNSLRFAQQHRDIMMRFGRFPHRNEVLGRTSSAEEAEFTRQGDGFGQQTISQKT